MIRESVDIGEMKNLLKRYNKDSIDISSHYQKYIAEEKRDIKGEQIIEFLTDKVFYFVEKQINDWVRYKIVYELSGKYDLVIVVKEEAKVLKVISAYKTNKKLKEKWKKMSKFLMTK